MSEFCSSRGDDQSQAGRRRPLRSVLHGCALVALCVGATGATAEEVFYGLEEITVTAQKISQSLQDTPLAISAVTGDMLQARGTTNVSELQIPNVTFGQFKADSQITIRGIGNENLTIGGDPGVAFHQDGVYLTRGAMANGDFFDIDRVEVLRGPQGTIYGRNAVGGVINVISTKPTDSFEGHGDILLGNYNRVRVRAAVNAPLADGLYFRVAGTLDDNDGYVKNLTTGNRLEDSQFRGLRGSLLFEPTADQSYLLTVVNERRRGSGLIRRLLTPQTSPEVVALGPDPDPQDPFEVTHNDDDRERIDHTGVSLTAEWNLGFADLKSISAFNKSKVFQFVDLDNTSADYVKVSREDRDETWTQELQLTGTVLDDRLDWIVGAFYMHSKVSNGVPYVIVPSGTLLLEADQKLESYAGFGQATYWVTPDFRLTAGIRYSHEKKNLWERNTYPPGLGDMVIERDTVYSNNAWTPRFVAEYDIAEDVMVYASITRGFKSGGFNASSFEDAYEPEFVWAYEAGIKSELFDHRLRANLSVFHYAYDDLQVTVKEPGDLVFSIKNAAQAEVNGVELELVAAPIEGLDINLAIGYLDATYSELLTADATRPTLGVLDLSGNRLPRSPKWKGGFGIQYRIDMADLGSLTPRADVNYTSRTYYSSFNLPVASQKAYAKLNLGLAYEPADANWRLHGFVKNVTNKKTITDAIVGQATSVSVYEGFYDPPRTFGVVLDYRF